MTGPLAPAESNETGTENDPVAEVVNGVKDIDVIVPEAEREMDVEETVAEEANP